MMTNEEIAIAAYYVEAAVNNDAIHEHPFFAEHGITLKKTSTLWKRPAFDVKFYFNEDDEVSQVEITGRCDNYEQEFLNWAQNTIGVDCNKESEG